MANISDLRKEVRLHANQCPDTTVDYALIRALRVFCKDSRYYQTTIFVNQVAGTGTYTLTPSSGEEVVDVEAVDLENDVKIFPATQDDASRADGSVTGFYFEPPNSLTILPEPTTNVTNGLEVRVALMPPESTTTLPDSIYRNHKEPIIAGALSFILSMQNEAWSNPSLAVTKEQEFRLGIFAAKGQRMRDFRSGGLRIQPRRFLI